MGSKRIRGVLFRVFSGEHAGAAVPHVHAKIASGELVVELLPQGDIRLSQAHRSSTRGKITESEKRHVLLVARDAYDELVVLWRMSQP